MGVCVRVCVVCVVSVCVYCSDGYMVGVVGVHKYIRCIDFVIWYLFSQIIASIAPSIYGHEDMKRAIALPRIQV